MGFIVYLHSTLDWLSEYIGLALPNFGRSLGKRGKLSVFLLFEPSF